MKKENVQIDALLDSLKERAKELNCFYRVEELLNNADLSLDEMFQGIIEVIPSGWQYPEICQAKIVYNDKIYQTIPYAEPVKELSTEIVLQGTSIGALTVSYFENVRCTDEGCFLKEEMKLLDTIANRISQTILYRKLKSATNEWKRMKETLSNKDGNEWIVIVDMLLQSD